MNFPRIDFFAMISGCKKALLLGVGGGNDIVSCVLPAGYMHRLGMKTDIAGMLSPVAHHIFDGKPERVINEIKGLVKREIVIRRNHRKEVPFVDGYLPHVCDSLNIPVKRFYNLSTRYGTKVLSEELNRVIEENDYDAVIGVDVGGDIFAETYSEINIKSPILDFTALYLLSQVPCRSFLLEFGMGTDGEMHSNRVNSLIGALKDAASNPVIIDNNHVAVNDFKKVFDITRKIRRGNTIPAFLDTLLKKKLEPHIFTHKSIYRVGDEIWGMDKKVEIGWQTCGKMVLVNAKKLAAQRSTLAVGYGNIIENYIRIKLNSNSWKTELDGYYAWSGGNFKDLACRGFTVHLLCIPLDIDEYTRTHIMQEGIKQLCRGMTDVALILSHDIENLENFIPKERIRADKKKMPNIKVFGKLASVSFKENNFDSFNSDIESYCEQWKITPNRFGHLL